MEPVIKSNGLGTPSPCLNYRIRVEGLNQIPNPNKKIDDFEGERGRCLLRVVGLDNWFHPSTLICEGGGWSLWLVNSSTPPFSVRELGFPCRLKKLENVFAYRDRLFNAQNQSNKTSALSTTGRWMAFQYQPLLKPHRFHWRKLDEIFCAYQVGIASADPALV